MTLRQKIYYLPFFFSLFFGISLFIFVAPSLVQGQAENESVQTRSEESLTLIPYSLFLESRNNLKTESLEYYLEILRIGFHYDYNVFMRIQAVTYMGRHKSKVGISLIHKTLISTKHPSLRAHCIDSLARIDDELSLMYIENALKDNGPGGELEIVNDNGEIQSKPFVAHGLEQLEKIASQDNKQLVAYPTKEDYLNVKRTASWALGQMARDKSINTLVKALEEDDLQIRINAAYSLGEIAKPGEELESSKYSVTDHINEIIDKFGNNENHPRYRIALAYPMLKLRKDERKGFYYLAKTLFDEDDFNRALSAKILGRLHDSRGLLPLEEAISRELSDWVRTEMSEALRQINRYSQS